MKKLLWITAGALLMIVTGYVREFLFVNINWQLSYLWYEQDVSNMSEKLSFLYAFDYWQLYYLKWILTVVCSVVYFFETLFILRWAIGSSHWKITGFLYLLLFVVSGIFHVGMALMNHAEDGYLIARYFMGLAQSPVPVMILLPALLLKTRLQSSH